MPAECSMLPKEKMQEIYLGKRELSISGLKEDKNIETRVALTPMGVSVLSASGHKVMVESNAGAEANYTNQQYSEAGAFVTNSRDELMKSDIIIKVSPFTIEEINMLHRDQTLISHLGVAQAKKETIQALLKKKVVAIALEYIITEKDFYQINYINSEISGRSAIFIASEYLGKQSGGKGVLLGGITGISPASVVILGTGTAALFAAKTALSVGAEVKVFDDTVYKLTTFSQRLGRDIFTSVLQPQVLNKALQSVDVLIGAKSICSHPFPIITEEMISLMKKGSVIVDLNVETGSCFETSHPTTFKNPAFTHKGIIHYCLPNIASLVPRTASIALSNALYPIINQISENGGIYQQITFNHLMRQSVYCYNGILTNAYLSKKFNIKFKDINLYLI